ncbi:hypothetical protein OESDEN_19343 [Oesophagostomum dentatum]|uniref:Uncharacterized protein n=1 Tax=Oesophagostomum dentatum TaxID=61180 RepID=A0A0B1SAQ7_OESDE|nr:hypothetical protein OESDEN_19343 [Oesophagostomum dentatum]
MTIDRRNAFEKNVGVAIFRNSNVGFDLTQRIKGKEFVATNEADDNGIDLDPYMQFNDSLSEHSSRKGSKGGEDSTILSQKIIDF